MKPRKGFIYFLPDRMAVSLKIAMDFFKYFMSLTILSFHSICWLSLSVLHSIINGFAFTNNRSPLKTAQLGRILWRCKPIQFMSNVTPLDFLCIFKTRVHPEYILQPNVSLYAITSKEAIFVETNIGVNIYSSEAHPFFLAAQYLNATNVIKMPISDFVSLADKIGDPTVPVIWISNTGRCGGTMLTQIFESVPGTLAIDQPDAPTNLHFLRECNIMDDEDYKVVLKSIIRVLCKPYPGTERICIKARPPCTTMMTDISNLYPDIRQLFIYRNSFGVIRSYLATMVTDPYPVVLRACTDAEWFSKFIPYIRKALQKYFLPKTKALVDVSHNISTAGLACCGWVNQILLARDALSHDLNIMSVKYEDILSRPRGTLCNIFDCVGISDGYIDHALKSLERDSLRGTPISRNKNRDSAIQYMSFLDRVECDAILSKYKLPLMGEDFRI